MPERIQRRRSAGFVMPAAAIYVGRPTVFGNPWKVLPNLAIEGPGMFFTVADEIDTAHEFAVLLYREWLCHGENSRALMLRRHNETRADRDELDKRRRRILGQLRAIRGHDLACWCAPGLACHADVLLELANQEVPIG